MGAISHSNQRHLAESPEFAVFPFNASKLHYNPLDSSEIDPTKQYPLEYQEFMSPEGTWNLYGVYHYAFDENTDIDIAKV